ncbi:Vacuolar protein sorting-associated protein 17 [Blastocladiella emersonii ATCC 22665]|nr:Vacuolar protein sorting-associated protein 17 [Blastocladiella emersonii ATCC 22665]
MDPLSGAPGAPAPAMPAAPAPAASPAFVPVAAAAATPDPRTGAITPQPAPGPHPATLSASGSGSPSPVHGSSPIGARDESVSPLLPAGPVNPLLRLYEKSFDAVVAVGGARWAGSELMVRFSAQTTLTTSYPPSFANERSHKDMERLCTHLSKTYATNLVPALPPIVSPPARALERAYTRSVEKFLARVLRHPVFAANAGTVTFFTSAAVFDPPPPEPADGPADQATSVRVASPSWSGKLRALVSTGPKDIDAEFEQRKDKSAELEFCLKALGKSADKLAAAHRAMAAALGDVSVKAAAMGAAEPQPALAGAWHKLSRRLQLATDLCSERAATEGTVLHDRLAVALTACGNAQAALDHRLQVLDAYDESCRATERHKRKMDKLRAGRPVESKVGEALAKFDAIKAHENLLRVQFRTASDLLARDWPVAEQHRAEDLNETLAAWARAEADVEHRMTGDVWGALRSQLAS